MKSISIKVHFSESSKAGKALPENVCILERSGKFTCPVGQLSNAGFDYKNNKDDVVLVASKAGKGAKSMLVVKTKSERESESDYWQTLGFSIYKHVRNWKEVTIELGKGVFPSLKPISVAQIAYGFCIASYQFDKYKSKKTKNSMAKLTIASDLHGKAKKLFNRLSFVLDGVVFARNLANEPANVMTPEKFVSTCKAAMKGTAMKMEVLKEKDMKKLGFGALLGVGQGSVHSSHTLVMRWHGDANSKDAPIGLVGKGVTFDTGGISIKPSNGMDHMIFDMCGAAAVAGTMMSLALSKAKVNVIGAVGLVENMPDAEAQRPGDIVKSYSGKTIQVLDTDAEGRLVLADVLSYVQKKYKVKKVVDLATLTGAVIYALGGKYAALCSNDKKLSGALFEAGQDSSDLLWELPMDRYYDESMDSKVADVANIQTKRVGAGTITAAQFLKRFINKDVQWAHLDIAGTSYVERSSHPLCDFGATGFGVSLLERFLLGKYDN